MSTARCCVTTLELLFDFLSLILVGAVYFLFKTGKKQTTGEGLRPHTEVLSVIRRQVT